MRSYSEKNPDSGQAQRYFDQHGYSMFRGAFSIPSIGPPRI